MKNNGVVVITLLVVAALLQYKTDRLFTQPPTAQAQATNAPHLSAPVTKSLFLGASELAADAAWIELLQYYGNGRNAPYSQLAERYERITELSPSFARAYLDGMLTLASEGYPEAAIKLGQKGVRNLPSHWEVYYNLGLVEHIYSQNFAAAADLFKKAAVLPNAPESTQYFAGVYSNISGDRGAARILFEAVMNSQSNPIVLQSAADYLTYLNNCDQLEKASQDYRNRFGRLPNTLSDLVTTHVLTEIPTNPLGFDYPYNPQTGLIEG